MSENLAISIKGVKKQYRLGQIGGGTLQGDLQTWWARKRGKEDPNSKIGSDQRLIGQTFMALNGIDLDIKKGEAIGIIGKNGAGKSTLLKLLSRVTAPTEGTIDIYGRVTSMLEVGTGFHREMTGRENVYMNGAILGMTKAEIDAKMEDIIEFSEVREFIDTPVKRYSSGMYVKLAFAVAAHLDSEIMIMDEVLAVGDMKFQQKCLGKMSDSATNEGKTVLYVSHNMNTIRQLCTRCVVLSEGRIIYDGDVEKAIQIYMQAGDIGYQKYYDLSRNSRNKGVTGNIALQNVEILNDLPISLRSKILIKLQWNVKSEIIKKAAFRVLIGSATGGLIGIAMSEDYEMQPGLNETILEVDTSVLAPGHYRANIEIFEMDNGRQTMHEGLRAFQFEISDDIKKMHNFHWYKPWGNILFSELREYHEQ